MKLKKKKKADDDKMREKKTVFISKTRKSKNFKTFIHLLPFEVLILSRKN